MGERSRPYVAPQPYGVRYKFVFHIPPHQVDAVLEEMRYFRVHSMGEADATFWFLFEEVE